LRSRWSSVLVASAIPASCQRPQAQDQGRIGQVVVAATADTARRHNFSTPSRHPLFEVAVFLVCFLLMFLLPPRPAGQPAVRGGRRPRLDEEQGKV
jgi:hypothetical protein